MITPMFRVRASLSCVLLLLVFHSVAFAQQPKTLAPKTAPKAAKIDEVMTMANKYRLFNGSVLVAEHGKVIYKKGLGLANMEWEIPNTTETKFRLA